MQFLKYLLSVPPLLFAAPVVLSAQVNTEYYVDASAGADVQGNGSLSSPFQTIRFALTQAATGTLPATILLNPGLYTESDLDWVPGVCLQGTNVLNTVITGEGGSILRFRASGSGDFDDVLIENVSIGPNGSSAGGAGVLLTNDASHTFASSPTFANCFISDNQVGVEIVSAVGGDPSDDLNQDGYIEHRPKIINCSLRANRVGISNREAVQVAQTFLGVNEPGILNVLIESDPQFNPMNDLNGIDAGDVISSAWSTANGSGGQMFDTSTPIGPAPVRVFDTTGFMWFVEDVVYTNPGLRNGIDIRVRPQSPSIDTGTMPILAWPNGTTGQTSFPNGGDIWDFDCEGYCNLRVEGNAIDIGADEHGELLVAGFIPFTTQLDPDPVINPTFGQTFNVLHAWIDPREATSANIAVPLSTSAVITPGTVYYQDDLLPAPGLRAPQTALPYPLLPLLGDCCLAPNFQDGKVVNFDPSNEGLVTVTQSPSGIQALNNLQIVTFFNISGVMGTLSNMQTYEVLP